MDTLPGGRKNKYRMANNIILMCDAQPKPIAYLCHPQTVAESIPTSGCWCRTHWSGGQHLEQSRCLINISIGQISKVPFNSTIECVILRERGSFSSTHAFKTHSAAR